ncbi:MAG: hypothetical protein JWO38_1258 [Gemmataceae bacterium]|nr:hypothetical protein [Gemmataceae bacterium]
MPAKKTARKRTPAPPPAGALRRLLDAALEQGEPGPERAWVEAMREGEAAPDDAPKPDTEIS